MGQSAASQNERLRRAGGRAAVSNQVREVSRRYDTVFTKRNEPMLTPRGLGFGRLSLPGRRNSAPTCRSGSPQFQHRAALVLLAGLLIHLGSRNVSPNHEG